MAAVRKFMGLRHLKADEQEQINKKPGLKFSKSDGPIRKQCTGVKKKQSLGKDRK